MSGADPDRRFVLGAAAAAALALAVARLAWPPRVTVAVFLGGAALAVLAEAVGVRAGLLAHHRHPQVAGVPVALLLGWPAVTVLALAAAETVTGGWTAVALASVGATVVDAALDPVAVRAGHWSYPAHPLSAVRVRGVPWWNAVAWLCLVSLTASLAVACR